MSVKVRDEAHFICLHPGRNEGCENTTEPLLPPTHGSQGRPSWMKPTVSDLCGSVNEAERRPEFGAMRKEKEAAGRKRQRKECVGESAPGSRSPLRFILSRHRRCRKRSFPSRSVSIIEITSGSDGETKRNWTEWCHPLVFSVLVGRASVVIWSKTDRSVCPVWREKESQKLFNPCLTVRNIQ